jgi:hypothetical protein
MANTKLSAFFSLLLVFCSGIVVGVFSYRVYNAPPHPVAPEERRKQLIDEMKREVHLDDGQVAQLVKIYDDTRERFTDLTSKRNGEARAIWDEQIAQIKALLRPDQIELYDKLRARKEIERERDRKQHRKGPPPGVKKD